MAKDSRLALTRDTVLVNLFEDNVGAPVYSISKAQLYAGPPTLTLKRYVFDFDAVPVESPDSAEEYVVEARNNGISFMRLSENAWQTIPAGFGWEIPSEDKASQAGTTNRLDLGYGDVQAATFRGGFIYAVHRIGASTNAPDGNALVWWKFDPTGASPAVIGIVDAPAGTILAYPSLAVNRSGGMLLTYCVLSSTTWPSAEYIYRDPAGHLSASAVIRTGNADSHNRSMGRLHDDGRRSDQRHRFLGDAGLRQSRRLAIVPRQRQSAGREVARGKAAVGFCVATTASVVLSRKKHVPAPLPRNATPRLS